ncbi:hypothetical protein DUI87_05969 [Hirundo rustica rustica]|uniref:Uncharacterized protein n=1 Tax=Hirundo rustica rustica TaxID=333673 RepID=A0A3M0KVY6_HIRRU|nr:hypothetical protein DUI87_05969 [Hirundo rustica rustica]
MLLVRVLEAVQINPPGVTDVVLWSRDGPVENPVVVRWVQSSSGNPVKKLDTWSPSVPVLTQLGTAGSSPTGWSISHGMMECVMSLVGPNGPLSEDVPLEDGGVVKEIRNTAPPGFNGWAIIRRHSSPSPLELHEKDKTSPQNQLSTDETE